MASEIRSLKRSRPWVACSSISPWERHDISEPWSLANGEPTVFGVQVQQIAMVNGERKAGVNSSQRDHRVFVLTFLKSDVISWSYCWYYISLKGHVHLCNSSAFRTKGPQSSASQFPACWGTLGPPAGLLMMMLSTLSTEFAASVAKRIAQVFATRESYILCLSAWSVPSDSA